MLVQESLAQIGIKTTINKIPGANWRNELLKKELPLISNFFSGWLDYPEYFFFWCYHGQNAVFNTMSYQDKDMDAMIDAARTAAADGDKAAYDKSVKGFVEKAFDEVPRIPLFQPTSTWPCRRTSRATATGSTGSSTTARSPKLDEAHVRDPPTSCPRRRASTQLSDRGRRDVA